MQDYNLTKLYESIITENSKPVETNISVSLPLKLSVTLEDLLEKYPYEKYIENIHVHSVNLLSIIENIVIDIFNNKLRNLYNFLHTNNIQTESDIDPSTYINNQTIELLTKQMMYHYKQIYLSNIKKGDNYERI